MKCKDCKALQGNRCAVLDTMRVCWHDCPIDDWAMERDKINASDRGEVTYMCHDDTDNICECLYGGKEYPEADCTHLGNGGHPKDCDYARRNKS